MRKSMLSLLSRALVGAALCAVLPLSLAAALPAGAGAETCPNAQFRTGASANLPDCRAYEMVTSPYKGGFFINSPEVHEGENGPFVTTVSFGVFAGAENDTAFGNLYGFARTASGWKTTSLAPSASLFPEVGNERLFAPNGSSLWDLGQQSLNTVYTPEGEVLYIKKSDGALVEVGPMISPSARRGIGEYGRVEGASRDLSHVLFEGNLWHGNSLYEYVGTGSSQPVLVGVSGGTGSTELIGQCGIGLASGLYGFNNVSADGSVVFFTPLAADQVQCGGEQPPVSELFARVDEAQTVAVSEPSLSYCSSSSCADAEFQGASEDGSKVFFTSTQNEEVPGVTDTTNNLYEAELGEVGGEWVRKRVVQASAGDTSGTGAQVQGVAAISEDGSHVYFVAEGALADNGGAAVEPGTGLPQHAAAGADNLYLYERDAAHPEGRTVFIARLSSEDSNDWKYGVGRAGVGTGGTRATHDGNFLAFTSAANLTPDDTTTNGERQLFEYDALTGTLVRVSIGQDGFNDNGNNPPEVAYFAEAGPTLSEDGSYVFFESTDGLTPQALNHQVTQVIYGATRYAHNVYEYHDGNVYLISDGRDLLAQEGVSFVSLVGTDASGANVFFTTSDPLVAQDTDTAPDIYDARIDGGFPAPVSLLPACSGDDCQGKLSSAPVLLSPGSEFQAGGNPPLAVSSPTVKAKIKIKPKAKVKAGSGKCRKGPVTRHGKCVVGKAPRRSARGRR